MVKTCCCTGHRPKGFPFGYGKDLEKHNAYLELLEEKIRLAITEYGVTDFISGMAIGADMDFAECVLKLKDEYAVTLECAIPCPDQQLKWDYKSKLRYAEILERADRVTFVSKQYTADCMLKRNRYLVDKSDMVIAVFNGVEAGGTWYTLNYARRENKIIEIIDLTRI